MKKLKSWIVGSEKRRDSGGNTLDFDEQFRRASASESVLKQRELSNTHRDSPPPQQVPKRKSIVPGRIVDDVEIFTPGQPNEYFCVSSSQAQPSSAMCCESNPIRKKSNLEEVKEIVKEKNQQKAERLQKEFAALADSYEWSREKSQPPAQPEHKTSSATLQPQMAQAIQLEISPPNPQQPVVAQPIQSQISVPKIQLAEAQPAQPQIVQAQTIQAQPIQACQPVYAQPICVAAQAVQMAMPCTTEVYVRKAKPEPIKSNVNSGLDILDDI